MVTKTKPKRYLTVVQLRERWGNVSQMFVERRMRSDPDFPKAMKFPRGRLRLFDESEVEEYERKAVVRGGSS
jgi:hypothetical protein